MTLPQPKHKLPMLSTVALAVLTLTMLPLIVGACTKTNNTTTKNYSTETLNIRIPQDMDTLDPHKASSAGTKEVMFNVFRGLLTPTPDGTLVGGIASNYSVNNNRTQYTFHIRPNVLFHNGNPVESKDVVYSYRRLMGSIDPSIRYKSLDIVTGVEAINTTTVRFTLSESNNSILTEFTRAIIPENSGDTIGTNPIGTGPYRLQNYSPTQFIAMEAFPQFYLGEARIKNVTFRIIPHITTTILAANSQSSNSLDIIPDLPYNNFAMLNMSNFNNIAENLNLVQILAYNHTYAPLANKDVRIAISQAINKTRIIDLLTNSEGTPLESHMTPLMGAYYNNSIATPYPYNATEALLSLKRSPYKNGFNLTITVPSNYQLHVDTAVLIAENLNTIGINTTIKTVEWGVWLNDVYKSANYEATVVGFAGKLDPYQTLRRYSSTYSNNFFHYNNATFDQLINTALRGNTSQSEKAYRDAQGVLAEDLAAYFIMDPAVHTAVRKGIAGWTTYPISVIDVYALYNTNSKTSNTPDDANSSIDNGNPREPAPNG